MPDDLYVRDVLAWSEQQAGLLRRVASGERVNGVDWENVVEEIESVGRSELHSVESLTVQVFVHLLKLRGWPEDLSVRHWRKEVRAFRNDIGRRYVPSMRQYLDLERLYRDALDDFVDLAPNEQPSIPLPSHCPVTLAEFLTNDLEALEAAFKRTPT